jgi:uncharacterized protein with HEPN domain
MIQLLRRAEVVRSAARSGYSAAMDPDRSTVAVILRRLHDHIGDAYTLTENRSPGELVADHLARLALERCVAIVAEAARRIPAERQAEHPEVPWEKLARLGAALGDPVRTVEVERLWEAVENDMPPLEAAIGALIEEFEDDGRP